MAETEGNGEEASVIYELLAGQPEFDGKTQIYFLAKAARLKQILNDYVGSTESLRTIRTLGVENGLPEVTYYADLEIGRMMLDSGGHPHIPNFDPTLAEIREFYDRVFAEHPAKRIEIADAHYKLGVRLWEERRAKLAAAAIEEFEKALEIVEEMIAEAEASNSIVEIEALASRRERMGDVIRHRKEYLDGLESKNMDSPQKMEIKLVEKSSSSITVQTDSSRRHNEVLAANVRHVVDGGEVSGGQLGAGLAEDDRSRVSIFRIFVIVGLFLIGSFLGFRGIQRRLVRGRRG
jgi:hypothetical protein